MKTESKKQIKEKEFDTVKTFREIKKKISKDIADMNLEQIKGIPAEKKSTSARLTSLCVVRTGRKKVHFWQKKVRTGRKKVNFGQKKAGT